YLVGSSVVSAMTQIPASGPLRPVTTPPMSSLSISTAACCAPAGAGTATAIAAMPIAPTVENRSCRRIIFSSLQYPGLSCPYSGNDIQDCITQKTESDDRGETTSPVRSSPDRDREITAWAAAALQQKPRYSITSSARVRAASGHAAAPPSSVMNVRPFTRSPRRYEQ